MQIDKNHLICNIPIIKIRSFLREHRRGFIVNALKEYFNLSTKEANTLIKILLEENYIAKCEEKSPFFKIDYFIDDKGFMLCAAHFIPPINRAKADIIYADFLQRVEEINKNETYLCYIEKLYLYGSYLEKTKDTFGDIDIAYTIKRKEQDFDKYEKLRRMYIHEKEKSGKRFYTFDEELQFPEREILLKMKNKCRYISLQPYDKDLFKLFNHKVIYPVIQ